MDPALLTATAGLRSRLETLELLGNNIANANTAGFKADREFYNLFLGAAAEADPAGDFTWMPVVEGSAIDFRQATLTPTAAPLDVALDGPGFFLVAGPEGALYTRNGSFRRARSGRLETLEGFALRGERGPVKLPPGEIKISQDGTIWAGQQRIDRLQVMEFAPSQPLSKVGRNYFRSADRGRPAARTSVEQGQLEAANVNPAETAVRLIEVTRQFEMLTRAVSLVANDMNRRVIEELPRSGS